MNNAAHTTTVNILGKEYQVACPPDEVDSLTQAARFLDQQMAQIRQSGKVVGLDRIAVMAALNIAHELLSGQSEYSQKESAVSQRLTQLNDRVGSALEQHKQLDL